MGFCPPSPPHKYLATAPRSAAALRGPSSVPALSGPRSDFPPADGQMGARPEVAPCEASSMRFLRAKGNLIDRFIAPNRWLSGELPSQNINGTVLGE